MTISHRTPLRRARASARWHRVAPAAGVLVALLAASCAVVDTVALRNEQGLLCQSAGGAYYLPKKVINVRITQATASKHFVLTLGGPKAVPDRQGYCLDYLGSPTSEDTVEIVRESNGLLKKVSSITADKSKEIAVAVLDIGLIAATGNPLFTRRGFRTPQGESLIAEFDLDPFDAPVLDEINTTLTGYGYCVLVEHHMVAQRRLDPHSYCDNPRRYAKKAVIQAPSFAPVVVPPEEGQRGILYRPDMTHQVAVLRKRDPGSRERWHIYQTKQLEMPNVSPVFSIPVDRSFFVTRTAKLDFKDGVLQDVTIEKPSEALAVSELPLKIAQAIAKIPGEIVKVRISATNNRERLIAAQTKLIETTRAYDQELENLKKAREKFNDFTNPRSLEPETPLPRSAAARGLVVRAVCNALCLRRPGQATCLAQCERLAEQICAGESDATGLQACLSRPVELMP